MKTLLTLLFLAGFPLLWAKPPNIVLIFADDLGYGDLSCYGKSKAETPHLDRMAQEGLLFRDFSVPANVCGPSRAALLTGRYPMRCGFPISRLDLPKYAKYGLAAEEITIPELLGQAGYENFLVGKWHLGFRVDGSHPLDAGFQNYYGIANNHSSSRPHSDTLYRNRDIAEEKVPYEKLTTLYTDAVVSFLAQERTHPFFILLAHNAVHTPIKPSAEFRGQSGQGAYADFVQELDHSTGRILAALKDHDLEEDTLVIFTSDNGPANLGSAGPLAGGKYVTMEGGHRVPALARWPGVIPPGSTTEAITTSMDFLPLFCALAGVALPGDRTIDGRNILPILQGETEEFPQRLLAYYNGTHLQAVRKGPWKLHLPRTLSDQPFWAKKQGGNRKKIHLTLDEPLLFNLKEDLGETTNLADKHPEMVAALQKEAANIQAELGNLDSPGSAQRPHGLIEPQERKLEEMPDHSLPTPLQP
ncbi:sulfatase [Roseibacillus ishigakijimensis]|uniref:Sulfatase n=1 Tax=Roseibacillus ishigakijimensis TaxID=454146 RepID=A0A934VMT0_9BACT|nr:sulfatase [Roseibacillus ishigakijimensis]MBK1834421.1 sulfatase [Roseibacillus ishigakijimensis]